MRNFLAFVIAAGSIIFTLGALAQNAPATPGDTARGKALVDGKGMTIYVFDRDKSGASNCNGQCAVTWPPLPAGADAKAFGQWTVIARGDGGKQWAYKGKPLYTYSKDAKAGDAGGDGVNGVWHIAAP